MYFSLNGKSCLLIDQLTVRELIENIFDNRYSRFKQDLKIPWGFIAFVWVNLDFLLFYLVTLGLWEIVIGAF